MSEEGILMEKQLGIGGQVASQVALVVESPLDCKEIQPVHSKGDQPWDFLPVQVI